MSLYTDICERKEKISVVGLGYVGMPLAVAFAKSAAVIGFDLNDEKIRLYKNGIDPTEEVGNAAIKETSVEFTSNPERLKRSEISYCRRSDPGESRPHAEFVAG